MPVYKIWDVSRSLKKTVAAKSLDELKGKGSEKLGISGNVKVVTEEDGTEIDEDEVLEEFDGAILILLKEDEEWIESGKTQEAAEPPKPKRQATSDDQATQEHDVMISYQWGAQERMLELKTKLEKEGIRVWMDVDEMAGNMDDRMSEGVEKAQKAVLVCFSKEYQASENCKREAQYAVDRKKRIIPLKYEDHTPTGWLGIILSRILYYDVRTPTSLEQNVKAILKDIKGTSSSSSRTKTPPKKSEVISSIQISEVIKVLDEDQLKIVYEKLELKPREISKAEKQAETANVDLRAREVFRFWQKTKGRDATVDKVVKALQESGYQGAVMELEDDFAWQI